MSKSLESARLKQHHRSRLRAVGRVTLLSAAVGIVAGVGAVLFDIFCVSASHFALGWGAGYYQKGPAGEPELFHTPLADPIPWLLLLIPTLGGLACGWITTRWAPEAEGHGTDAAISAYHHKQGKIRGRVPIVKMLTSAITLGTGGSGGREGPIAQIGAGFGSFLATKLGLSTAERRMLMAAGMGAGIGAIFHAPLAGAIFAAEVLYRDPDFESEVLIPAFISTTLAYCVFNILMGFFTAKLGIHFEPYLPLMALAAVDTLKFDHPLLLLPLTVLALVMVGASWAYVRTFYGMHRLFKGLKLPRPIKPALGAFLTGLVAVIAYYAFTWADPGGQSGRNTLSVLSFGYGYLQQVIQAHDGAGLSIAVLLTVGVGKILTTSLTISSGGSGGVFAPSMVIGGTLGAVIGLIFKELMPGTVERIDVFVLLGMASFFAAAAKTPVSTLIMVSEMAGSYQLLLPSMWVCAGAYLLSRGWSIFSEQVGNRLDSPAHRGDLIIDVLKGVTVRDSLTDEHKQFMQVPLDMSLREVAIKMTDTRQTCFPVVDGAGRLFGILTLQNMRQFLYDSEAQSLACAHDLATPMEQPLTLDMDLSSAIGSFEAGGAEELPVVDADDPLKVLAMLRHQDLLATYNKELIRLKRAATGEEKAS